MQALAVTPPTAEQAARTRSLKASSGPRSRPSWVVPAAAAAVGIAVAMYLNRRGSKGAGSPLDDLQSAMTDAGVTDFSAHDVTWSRQGGGNIIPPPELAPNLVRVAVLAQRIRTQFGAPLWITSGFRPEPLNTQVGGVPNSQHIRAAALDLTIPTGQATADGIDRLRMIAAREWVRDPSFHGLGMYDSPPGRIHVDVDHVGSIGRRTWPEGRVEPYIARARA